VKTVWHGKTGETGETSIWLITRQIVILAKHNILPAVPAEWPTGSVKGIVARGGYVVDLSWKDGTLTGATIRSTWGTVTKLRYGAKVIDLNLKPGQIVHLNARLQRTAA
jgi:hypothetical protein